MKATLRRSEERITHLEGMAHDGGGFDLTADRVEDIEAYIERLPRKQSVKKRLDALKSFIEAWLAVGVK